MPNSEDDVFKVVSDFIKGKIGPEGTAMAKLSWEGTHPPTLPERPKLSESFAQLAAEYPLVVSSISRCSRLHTTALVGAMLTLPELQGNCYRLEILAHFAAQFANGKDRPTSAQLCAWFNQLDNGTCGRLEDPSEDLFISNVYFSNKNYRLFEGTAEGNAFYTQIFLNIIELMPNTGGYASLKRSVGALLSISDEIAVRAMLPKNIVGYPNPQGTIRKPKNETFIKIRHRNIFSDEEIHSLGIDLDALKPFEIQKEEISQISDCTPGFTPLDFKPLIRFKDKISVALPSTFGLAIRNLIVEGCIQNSLENSLERSLCQAYENLFKSERLLSALQNPPLHFRQFHGVQASVFTIEIDVGRYLNFIFYADDFANYHNGAFLGMNSFEPVSEFVKNSIEATTSQFSAMPGFREGITIIVGCGWGRSLGLALPDDKPNWRIEVLSAHDLVTLGRYPSFEALDLFRVLDARDAVERLGITLINANGFLNLFGWMNDNDGHIVPHEKLDPDFIGNDGGGALLNITQNSLLKVRYDAANAVDMHIVVRPDGIGTLARRVNGTPRYGTKGLSPFYADVAALENRLFRSVYEGSRRNFWIEAHVNNELELETRYQLSNMVMNWGEAIFRYIDQNRMDEGNQLFSCSFHFNDIAFPSPTDAIPSNESIREIIQFDIDAKTCRSELNVKAGFLSAGRRADNLAERAIVSALLRACLACVAPSTSTEAANRIVEEIIGDDGARHFHAFSAADIRDYVRDSLPTHGQIIERMDDANSRLGLGWLVRNHSDGAELAGQRECCDYLNAMVRALGERIKLSVSRFDRTALIKALLMNHEALFAEQEQWKRTFRAVRALSEDQNLATKTAADKIAHFNAASLASRIIAEIALCESPMAGGILPGKYDIAALLANASQMFHLGGYSDAMNVGVMPAKIRISPAGDILMDHGFTDEVIRPFGLNFQSVSLNDAAENYAENYAEIEEANEQAVGDSSSVDDVEFYNVWKNEFGVTIEDVRSFAEYFSGLATEIGEAILEKTVDEIVVGVSSLGKMENQTAAQCLELFSLIHRKKWDETPAGFKRNDWLPWRFRRRLSVIAKPILQLERGDNARCIVAPVMIVHHIEKFVSDVRFGRFDDQAFPKGKPVSKWIGKINHAQGEAFNKQVADRFVELGWQAEPNLSDGRILNRASDPAFGDVDVLAWSKTERRVLVAECKDLSFDKTFGEIARRLARYRGLETSDGERDDLKKHLDRCSALNTATAELSKFVGFDVGTIEPMLIFSQPTPMQFHKDVGSHGVQMLTFRDIAHWLKTP